MNPRVLHAADYGVPQSRERVFFIGIKKSALNKSALEQLEKENISEKYNPYPKPTHAYTTDGENLKRHVDLKELFENIEEPEKSKDLSQQFYSKAKFMGKHCQGQIEIKPDGISPTIRAEHHGNIEFRRLSKKNGGILTEELLEGLKERRLTPRECALIQTFPPDYEFVIANKQGRKGSYLVSPSKAYKVIGNAVPPLLAYNLAKRIEDVWDLYFKKIMVVSVNSEPLKSEFNILLNSTIEELNAHAKKSPKKIEQLRGNKLEPYVRDVMTDLAVGSQFENSIELIGGQKFPDIVAKKFYGIEVKTTTQNHWKTTGNSVLESTRVDDVERIFMLFGKLGKPIEFRCRAYEECLFGSCCYTFAKIFNRYELGKRKNDF